MPTEEANYIFPSNMTYKNNGKLENEHEILSNIRRQLTDDPKHMNAGCALIRLPLFVLIALVCIFGTVGAASTIIAMIAENRIDIFILLGWFSVILGAGGSLHWSWVCLRAIISGPNDHDKLARSSYQHLMKRGTVVDTRVFQLTNTWGNTDIFFTVHGKTFVYITKHGNIKHGDTMKALCANGICVLL